jgi:hypothetical protein
MLVSCLASSSTLKIEAICSSETSADFQQTIWPYIPEDLTLHNFQCENLRSYIANLIFNQQIYYRVHKNLPFHLILVFYLKIKVAVAVLN